MKIIKGRCRAYSNEGNGIVNADNLTIFVKGLFLDEEADIELTWSNNKIAYGKVVKLHSISKDRIPMQCPVGTSCGGCSFQALTYEKEIEFKIERIKQAFKMFKMEDINFTSFTEASSISYYRNKIQIPFGLNNFKQVTYGFYKSFSHEIVPIKECFIENKKANEIISTIRNIMVEEIIAPYNEERGTGVVRNVMIRTSKNEKEIMVVIVTNKKDFKHRDFLFQKLINRHPEITSLIQNVNSKNTNVILGDLEILIHGKPFIEDVLCGNTYQIAAKSFYQVNHEQCENLYRKAIILANFDKNDVVLDAYCGVGTIALSIAKHVKKVIGVEIVKEAIENANINKRINKISNVEFYCGDVKNVVEKLNERFDTIVVDPPRKGLSKEFKEFLLESNGRKIIYVSCDPITLARDIKDLEAKYEMVEVCGFDMFPRTHHVETVVLLELKK